MSDVVIVGIGQLGATFAHGFLRAGRTVHPVTRGMDLAARARAIPEPGIVLLTVGEADLPPLLEALPEPWRDRVALVQNELLPVDWQRAGVEAPTVAVVWFEKKAQKPLHPILPTPIGGPHRDQLAEALAHIGVGSTTLDEEDALLFELVRKNLYILTANVAGLEVGGTVGALWGEHRALATAVARDVLQLQAARAGRDLEEEPLLEALGEAFEADPEHGCRGRSAPARLARALDQGRSLGVALPALSRIAESST